MKQESVRALPTMYQVLPPVARDLAVELESLLGTGGARTRLKVGAALACAAVMRDHDLWRALQIDAGEMGEADVARLALDAAMRYAYAGDTSPADATTRIVRLALIHSLRSEELAGDDPLVAECSEVVSIVHALAIARAVDQSSEDLERATSFLRLGKRPDSNRANVNSDEESRAEKRDSRLPPLGVGPHHVSPTPPGVRSSTAAPPVFERERENAPVSQRPRAVQSSVPPADSGRQKEKTGGPRVLLVDDDDSYAKLLLRMLSPLDVVHASTGASAMDILAADSDFEIILSKVELPEVSGAQMYETIKRKWPHLATQTIFVSSHGSAPDGRPLLRKPINRDSLLRTIGRISKRIAEVHQK